jgi:ABC-type proline/glycine betaine transport system permease subunit
MDFDFALAVLALGVSLFSLGATSYLIYLTVNKQGESR